MEQRVRGFKSLSEKSGVPERTLRTLWKNGLIPGEVCGHRTILFVLPKVERALAQREVKAKNGAAH
jgi:hypothetical protein